MRNRYRYCISFLICIKLFLKVADNNSQNGTRSNSLEKNSPAQKNVPSNKELHRDTKTSQSDGSIIKPQNACFKKKIVNKVRSWNSRDGKSAKKAADVSCASAVSK